jgi:hypothetical protein
MKNLALILILIAAAAGASAWSRVAASGHVAAEGRGPRIRFEAKTQSFGAVPHGAVVRRRFAFVNEGDGDLVLSAVRTSCGCTAALPSKRRLAPGEEAAIDVTFDTGRKPAARDRTRYANTVMVTTNDLREHDAGTGVTRLVLEGDVITRYRVIPEMGALLPALQRGAGAPAAVTVTVVPLAAGARLALARLESSPPWARVEGPRPTIRDGKESLELSASFAPDAPLGIADGAIVLATGDPEQPEVRIAVRGQVLPKVSVAPSRLYSTPGQPPRPILLSSTSPVHVVGVEIATDDGLPAPIAVQEPLPAPANRVSLMIAGARGAPNRPVTGEIRVLLADPDLPVLTVPFRHHDPAGTRAAFEAQRKLGVRVSPPEVDLGDLAPGQTVETSIVVSRAGPEPIDVEDLAVEPEGALDARVEPIAGGQAVRIVVAVRAAALGERRARPSPVEAFVRFRPRAGAEEISIRVAGRVQGVVAAAPAGFYLGGKEAVARLRRTDGKPLRVARAEALGVAASVRFDPEPDGAVKVTLAPGPEVHGKVAAKARIETDDAALGAIELPVFGEVP